MAAAAGCRAVKDTAGAADAVLPPRLDPNLSVLISDIHVPQPWSEQIDKKSLFRRHGHPPAGTGLNERFHGGNVVGSGW